jgi:hypothetical protein
MRRFPTGLPGTIAWNAHSGIYYPPMTAGVGLESQYNNDIYHNPCSVLPNNGLDRAVLASYVE